MASIKKDGDKWVAEIDPGDGTPLQYFRGDSQEEVVSELIKAQSHATRKIREQGRALKIRQPVQQERSAPQFKPRTLTADEQFKIQQGDPDALKTVIEAEFGASLEEVRATLRRVNERDEQERLAFVAKEFLRTHADFKACPENDELIVKYLRNNQLPYTVDSLSEAYDDLKLNNLLQLKTAVSTAPVAPASSTTTRPRSVSTGLPAQAGRSLPSPKELTADEIYRMPAEEYRRNLSNPQFAASVEKALSKR